MIVKIERTNGVTSCCGCGIGSNQVTIEIRNENFGSILECLYFCDPCFEHFNWSLENFGADDKVVEFKREKQPEETPQ